MSQKDIRIPLLINLSLKCLNLKLDVSMKLKKLFNWPNPKLNRYILIFSIICIVIIYPIMMTFYVSSEYPENFIVSQLSFSGQVLKDHYSETIIKLYRVFQILDYGFMICYGLLFFSIVLILARKFDEESKWMKSGFIVAILGLTAAACDAIEDGFILLTLIDPSGFPDILAIMHSIFALLKFIQMIICITWLAIAFIWWKLKK